MKLFCKNSENVHKIGSTKIIKILLIMILLSLTMFLKTEVFAFEVGTYGKDNFGEEYSNGYIRDCTSDDVIRISQGIVVKKGKQINNKYSFDFDFYTSDNTSKLEYIDYLEAARYINSKGESIWLDMRIYVWTSSESHPWAINNPSFSCTNLSSGVQHTTIEFHFYTTGHCGDSNYEQSFKGVTNFNDLDYGEGILFYSGYNKFYLKEGIPLVRVLPGNDNSNHRYNPFATTGIAEYPYFFRN